jgi:dolichol-phosphate mannosyltransferase
LRLAVIVPTYNEAENITRLAGEILALPLDAQLIIVDDNSPDGTGDIADRLAAADRRVHVVHRPGKLGLGTAYIAGFRRACELEAEAIVTMDADFSHQPRYIPVLVAKLETCDLVIGSRYVPGGGTQHCTLPRRLLSQGANAFARVVLCLHAHDCTAGFRCYRRQALQAIPLEQIFSSGYSFLIEMLYACQSQGFRVGEAPIIFENRQRGASKISRLEIAKALYTVLILRFQGLPWGRWRKVAGRSFREVQRTALDRGNRGIGDNGGAR